jgi:integrase
VRIGTPLYTVSKLMGHSTLRMTERYAHLAPDTQKAAAMDLEGILGDKGGM